MNKKDVIAFFDGIAATWDAAQIDKKCTVIGAADHIEIWSDEKWDAYESEAGESFESVAESLTEFLR